MAIFQRGKVWYCSWYEKIGGELIQKKKAS